MKSMKHFQKLWRRNKLLHSIFVLMGYMTSFWLLGCQGTVDISSLSHPSKTSTALAVGPMKTTQPSYSEIAPPNNPIDMLKNAMFALQNDFLLRKDFYADDNLKHFFSGKYVTGRSDSENYTNGNLLDFRKYDEQIAHIGENYPCDMRSFDWSIDKNGKVKSSFYFSFRGEKKLTFEVIENIFGRDSGWQSDFSPIAYGETAMVGGRKYFRVYSTAAVIKRIEFIFGPDAVLFTADFREEEK